MKTPYPEYNDDVALCREIHSRHGKSFYFGTLLLDRAERDATCVLYAFFRFPDEYVDTYYADRKDIALEKLTRWNDLWTRVYHGELVSAEISEQRILRATKYIFDAYHIPFSYSQAFLAAMIQDTNKERYATYAELEQYMYGSAGVVGLMMTYVLCSSDHRFRDDLPYRDAILARALALGEAFQMTNFLRDVGEDIRDRGRIYLPQEDMQRFGVSDEDIIGAKLIPQFISLMQFEIERTEALYNRADEGIAMLPRRAGRGIAVARTLYAEIIPKIVASGYDVFSSRAHVPFFEKVRLSIPAFMK
jgi:phytoene synthase